MNQSILKAQSTQTTATTQIGKSELKQPEKVPQKTLRIVRPSPVLRFSPVAWAKLLYFRDRGQTEVGGFAVTSASDLLKVEDFVTVKQAVTVVSVSFDDQSVADFFDEQVDAGRKPEQFGRIWLHTHPGDSPMPSCTDEETFARVFGSCQWAVMFILADSGKSYARLRFNVAPGGDIIIPAEVDFRNNFPASDIASWEHEYLANIHPEKFTLLEGISKPLDLPGNDREFFGSGLSMDEVTLAELAEMDEDDRDYVLAELGYRSPGSLRREYSF